MENIRALDVLVYRKRNERKRILCNWCTQLISTAGSDPQAATMDPITFFLEPVGLSLRFTNPMQLTLIETKAGKYSLTDYSLSVTTANDLHVCMVPVRT
jgi:hypothetical protein